MPGFFMFDGKMVADATPILGPDSRAFRYGDGLFETIRIHWGRIPLFPLHADRCFRGLETLGFQQPPHVSATQLEEKILSLARKNGHLSQGRVRLTFFRGDGGLYDPVSPIPHYIIQTWALPDHYLDLNENGLVLTVYPQGQKSTDQLANLKSNNALLYVLAAQYAKQQRSNEALVLNTHGRIADATIANCWWVRDGIVHTVPLSEGPVAGVMRRALIDLATREGTPVVEMPVTPEALESADEVFLTNALYGIRWVGRFNDREYPCKSVQKLYDRWIGSIFTRP
jgi:branched-chain amino acid aminotransferase